MTGQRSAVPRLRSRNAPASGRVLDETEAPQGSWLPHSLGTQVTERFGIPAPGSASDNVGDARQPLERIHDKPCREDNCIR